MQAFEGAPWTFLSVFGKLVAGLCPDDLEQCEPNLKKMRAAGLSFASYSALHTDT